mmetsp:Transcript_6675/g.7609  ORF Transcript_6675/g.7609 Transcript_6675/m.7609 type:complete len:361 (+) Transcript_6675:199-1281(+)
MPVDNPNVGVAFLLVIGAGLATALGASVVFFPTLVKLASRRVLAAALGLSAGVMTYVSFVEIFPKSSDSFGEAGIEENTSYVYATLCFFGGGIIMLILDFLVKSLSGRSHNHNIPADNKGSGGEIQSQQCFTCSPDPVGDLDRLQNQADSIIRQENDPDEREFDPDKEYDADAPDDTKLQSPKDVYVPDDTKLQSFKDEEDLTKPEENKRLVTMGINTAIAIGLHNFPEGLATFVAALDDPRVGAVLAIAIGIHNIPEGLCVALPIYYATGNRMKAFAWALLSGASEPIAALLGWAVLANSFSPVMYAVLFGLVGGMMVIISIRELLPTAHRYDPEDTVVTISFILGMFIMALSLVLFVI